MLFALRIGGNFLLSRPSKSCEKEWSGEEKNPSIPMVKLLACDKKIRLIHGTLFFFFLFLIYTINVLLIGRHNLWSRSS